MKVLIAALATFAVGSYLALADEPKPVGALPPLPIDKAFEKATTPKELDEALLNDAQYTKSIKAALKAKQAQEAFFRKNPKAVGPSPAQAARRAFLEILAESAQPAVGK